MSGNTHPITSYFAKGTSKPTSADMANSKSPDLGSQRGASTPATKAADTASKRAHTAEGASEPSLTAEPAKKRAKTAETSTSEPSIKTTVQPQTLKINVRPGDIFSAPTNTVLIHACNTQGSWGAGIALAFRTQYPSAYKVYRDHCTRKHQPTSNPVPTGTCLLIPPCEEKSNSPRHWIACLFTSRRYGRGKDKPDVILANTGPAMRDMIAQIKRKQAEGDEVKGLWMCKINSARFGVPWERTVKVLEGIEVEEGDFEVVEVWTID